MNGCALTQIGESLLLFSLSSLSSEDTGGRQKSANQEECLYQTLQSAKKP